MAWWRRFFPRRDAADVELAREARESRIAELKKAFDLQRVGIQGLPVYPSVSIPSLQGWYRRNELAYACIRKIAEALLDPEPIVEKRVKNGQWEVEPGHPMRRLLNKPNAHQTGAEFFQSWVVSEQIAGAFYAEIVRSSAGVPVQLWPLDPSRIFPIPAIAPMNGQIIAGYEFRAGDGQVVRLEASDLMVSRLVDITNPFHGLAPLAVALGSVEADSQQTDYVRAFFSNSGIPSGIIKYKGVLGGEAGKKRADEILQRWMARYGWGGRYEKGPAILDDNAEYQQIGSNLKEIESETLRAQIEARICSVFGVPPILVGAFVGLLYVNQRATAKAAHEEFWMNTMSPMLKRLRTFLTWNLLPEWEGVKSIHSEQIRANWDMSQVMALQEEIASRSTRAREDFRVGLLTLNQALGVLGYPAISDGDYYLRRANQIPITADVVREQLEAAALVTQQSVAVMLTGARDPEAAFSEEDEGDGEEKRRQTKVFDWEGVHCWREPSEIERKIRLVDTGKALDAGQVAIGAKLRRLRGALIDEAIRKLVKMTPREYHKLILDWPGQSFSSVRSDVDSLYSDGRALLRREIDLQGGKSASKAQSDADEQLDSLAEATIARLLNDIQSRASSAASHFALLPPIEFERSVRERLESASGAFIESAAAHASHSAVALGREVEMKSAAEPGKWIYGWVTALEFGQPCQPCYELETFTLNNDVFDRDDLPKLPYPKCGGGFGRCRCTVVMMKYVPK